MFELKPKISISEKEFFSKLENPKLKEELKEQTIRKNDYVCQGCEYRFYNQEDALRELNLHLIEENEENLEDSQFTCLCKACHTTQHIDVAIKNNWIKIVNSCFEQKNLIEMCRINSVDNYIRNKEIIVLKTSPEEYLENLINGTVSINSRVKIIYTDNFKF